jgi:microcystin-dependent protein
MSNYEATKYDFDGGNLTGIEGTATGTILPWSSASVPTGFLECDGAAVSRSTYSVLFGVVGTTYGTGDGSSTFNLPNLADNIPMGKSGTKALASTGGANTVAVTPTGNIAGSTANATLSTSQLAAHNHSISSKMTQDYGQGSQSFDTQVGYPGGSSNQRRMATYNTQQNGSGGGHSHNMSANFSGSASNPSVLQPYLTLLYIIKT